MNHAGEATLDGFPVDLLTGMENAWEVTPPRRSLAIVGSHPATRENAPYDDPNFEIWLFNEAPQKPEVYRRWDASFQMHTPKVYASLTNWVNKDHWNWLQQDHGKTIWMQEVDPRVPNSKRYPIEGVMGLVPYHYLRSTPAMALALAIYLGYEHIQLYGSELSSNTEYTYQAINYAFWIGFAHGRGINLELMCWQDEFYKHPLYGYEGETQLPKELFVDRLAMHTQSHGTLDRKYKQQLDRLADGMMRHQYERVAELTLEIESTSIEMGEHYGRMKEAERYAGREDFISRQEFERVSAQSQLDGEKFHQLMWHKGGICEYLWNAWKGTGSLEALNQLRVFMKDRTQAAYDMGKQFGIFRENLYYMEQYDKVILAAGGQRAVYQVSDGKS